MNKYLIIIGSICALLWGFVTALTFGIPQAWCEAIDRMTFHVMSREVFQMANGFYYDVRNSDMPTIIFLIVFGVIFALVFFMMRQIEKRPVQRYSLFLVIFFSIIFRLILLPGELIHENDIYRYIWDGKTTLQGINPYKYAPADVFMYEEGHRQDYYDSYHEVTIKGKAFTGDDAHNLEALLELRDANPTFHKRIGHWQVPTIYPPVIQALFTIPVFINGNSLIWMKSFFMLFDIGSLFLIVILLKHFKKNPCMSVIYGWSPLVLFMMANGGHYDVIPIFLTLLSLVLYTKGRRWAGVGALALATLSKFFSGVLLPILFRPFKMRYLLFFGSGILLFYAPFIFWDQTGIGGVFEGLRTYNQQWSYNSSIFALIYTVLEKLPINAIQTLMPAKIVVGCLYLATLIFLTARKSKNDLDVIHKCFLAIAGLFIINPVADPWYFCWVMPFLCLFPYRSWLLLSGLLALSYLNFHAELGIIGVKFWNISVIGWIIYIPFFLYLVVECFHRPKFGLDK